MKSKRKVSLRDKMNLEELKRSAKASPLSKLLKAVALSNLCRKLNYAALTGAGKWKTLKKV
ncbi:MAG: hypothetical protein ABH860_05705 [bacterium]